MTKYLVLHLGRVYLQPGGVCVDWHQPEPFYKVLALRSLGTSVMLYPRFSSNIETLAIPSGIHTPICIFAPSI